MPSHVNSRPKFRRLKSGERRQMLVEATLRCLSRFGPHGTGVREICLDPAAFSHATAVSLAWSWLDAVVRRGRRRRRSRAGTGRT